MTDTEKQKSWPEITGSANPEAHRYDAPEPDTEAVDPGGCAPPVYASKPKLTLRFTVTVIRELTVDPRDYSDDGVTPELVDHIIAAELLALEEYDAVASFVEHALASGNCAVGRTVERVA